MSEFVGRIVRRLRLELAASEAGVRLGVDAGVSRTMQSAAARLHSALDLFAPYLPNSARVLVPELQWLADLLEEGGRAEVQSLRLTRRRRALARRALPSEDLEPLERTLRVRASAARARTVEALDSPRYRLLVEALGALGGECEGWSSPILEAVAPALIDRRYRDLRRGARRAALRADAVELRALEERASRFGYALELLAERYGRAAARVARDASSFEAAVRALRDAMVVIQELRVLVREYGQLLPPETVFALGVLAERERARAMKARGRRLRALRRFGRRSWPRLARVMRRRTPPLGERPPATVLEAHGLGPGVTAAHTDEARAARVLR